MASSSALLSSSASKQPLKTLTLLRAFSTPSDGRRGRDDDLPEQICRMMAKRPWTTRLEHSIHEALPTPLEAPLVLAVIRRARSPLHALNFFRFAERRASFRHTPDTRLEIIRTLCQHSLLNHARCILLQDPPSGPLQESMFIPLIDAYASAGIPQESVKLFRMMPDLGVPRTLSSHEAFLKAILRRGRGAMAKRAFNSMLREGITPTLYTYNIMIWGFCLSEMMPTATRFLSEMKERGIEPDVVTFNTIISGWVRTGWTGRAQEVFDEMRQRGLQPNTISYTTLIKGMVQEGDTGEALRMFREMQEVGVPPSEKTFNVLLPGLCGDPETAAEARALLETMAERHFRPTEDRVFLTLVSCLCDAGRPGEALEVLRLVDRFRIKLGSAAAHYSKLIDSFCKDGSFDKAIGMIDEVLERGVLSTPGDSTLGPDAYVPVIAHMCGNGMARKAEIFFRLLMKKGVDDAVAFNHLIRGHSNEGSPEAALELLTIMDRRGVASDAEALVLLVESFVRKGEPADAKAALDVMIEHGHLPSSSLFRSVMESLFENDRVQTASRVMKSMIEKGVKDNMDMVHKILEALLMRGHVEEAIDRIDLLMVNDCVPNFDKFLNVLCEKDKVSAALKLADFGLERDCDISFESYDRVLSSLSSCGKTLNAYSLLCKIQNKGGHTNKEAASALVKSLIDEGNTKQADILSRLFFPKERRGKGVSVTAV